jgi:hypothetical protein
MARLMEFDELALGLLARLAPPQVPAFGLRDKPLRRRLLGLPVGPAALRTGPS